MASDNHFHTGMELRLARLLDNDIKIIIPDLQRDYCWGTTLIQGSTKETLASRYVHDLIEQYLRDEKDLSLGLIYGYEVPAGHVQLCDGQQRITTLYLLLGMLNKRTRTLEDRLISQRELDDDKEPYLQYAIRESSLYFLSDLVNNFFLSNFQLRVKDIAHQPWFFNEYDNDPSICSMLATMQDIEKQLDLLQGDQPYRFAYFLCHNIKFIYYDMESRRQGEETFVIINTKGEPLSATENMKPEFIDNYKDTDDVSGKKEASDFWEEMETFFWQNRSKRFQKSEDADGLNDTADAGMHEFFRWLMMLHLSDDSLTLDEAQKSQYEDIRRRGVYTFDYKAYSLDDIKRYFHAVEDLFGANGELKDKKAYLSPKEFDDKGNPITNQANWYRTLPMLLYLFRFPQASPRNRQRMHHFIKYTIRVDNINKSIETVLPSLLNAIRKMPDEDILHLNTACNNTLFSDEIKTKFNNCPHDKTRNDYEDALWKAEDDERWQYEIMPIIKWSTTNGKFSLQEFINYRDTFAQLFGCVSNDLIISLLLLYTQADGDYPCYCTKFCTSKSNLTFGIDIRSWREVIEHNVDAFGAMIKSLFSACYLNATIYSSWIVAQIKKLVTSNSTLDGSYLDFVREGRLLPILERKNVRLWNGRIVLVKKTNATSTIYLHLYEWYLEQLKLIEKGFLRLHNAWGKPNVWWDNNGGCIYFDNTNLISGKDLAIDVRWNSVDGFSVFYFCRGNNSNVETPKYCGIKAKFMEMEIPEGDTRYVKKLGINTTAHDVMSFVLQIMDEYPLIASI